MSLVTEIGVQLWGGGNVTRVRKQTSAAGGSTPRAFGSPSTRTRTPNQSLLIHSIIMMNRLEIHTLLVFKIVVSLKGARYYWGISLL